MKEIPLSQNKISLIDDEDYEIVSQYKWFAHKERKTFYAHTNIRLSNNKRAKLILHRLIMKANKGEQVDHKDRDGLNCQKYNLRIATPSQNAANKEKRSESTSPYKGTYFHKSLNKWQSKIMINGKNISFGLFSSVEEAARAYDEGAKKYFGEFAYLNFPE